MPFTVQFRILNDSDWDDPLDYDDCETVVDVLMHLLAEWAAGDVDLHGTFGFLTNHGHDFGIADDAVDEGTDGALLERAGEVVLGLCADSEVVTQEYLIAIGGRVRIVETGEIDDTSSTEGVLDSEDEE